MVGINNFPDYQRRCRDFLIQSIGQGKQRVVVKSPTGSGKTVILISMIEQYLIDHEDTVFVWLCPGAGDLEQQSKESMEEKLPTVRTKDMDRVITDGFQGGDACFINWEQVTKRDNKATRDKEKGNLFEKIAEAHRHNLKFVIIIDEEQSNDTSKAQDIISAFACEKEIRVSATAKKRPDSDWFEIKEKEVIDAGFITKAIIINQGVDSKQVANTDENSYLVDLAIDKQKEIQEEYAELDKNIRPLIVIQFPSNSDPLIKGVEEHLAEKGYTYENKLVAKWMADTNEKINLVVDGKKIEDDDGFPIFLLMKQAISTGWDCRRAKILVKLRTNMDEDFEIQTIGRIRRMPERVHYGNDLLDNCFLFTLDEKYVQSVKESTDSAFNVKKVRLQDQCISFNLMKELKDSTNPVVDDRAALESAYTYFKNTYHIGKISGNQAILAANGYIFDDSIIRNIKQGSVVLTEDLTDDENVGSLAIKYDIKKMRRSMIEYNATHHIAQVMGMDANNASTLLKKLFQKSLFPTAKQILNLDKREYFAFIANNEKKLIEDCGKATSQLAEQARLGFDPLKVPFTIPREDWIEFNPYERAKDMLGSNAYVGYDEQTLVDGIRSKTEREFEEYCNGNSNVNWYYKNGDSGVQYFSLVYIDSNHKQRLFFPDYIVRMKNTELWIIEAKGGQSTDGTDQNIDVNVDNKFAALKRYCSGKNIKWGFVRSLNDHLYIDNTIWKESMDDETVWLPLSKLF